MPRRTDKSSAILVSALLLAAPAALHAQYAINVVAGGGPNGLPALSSSIGFPGGIARDALTGNIYVADADSSRIFKIDVSGTPAVTVFAGNGSGSAGEGGYSGDGGPATLAQLGRPDGVAVDASGNVFIADTDNSVIREVAFGSGTISTVAGTYYPPTEGCNNSGDNESATSAQLCRPGGVFVDASGNIFIADTENSVIREVVAATGNIQTVAGNAILGAGYSGDDAAATSAQLKFPYGVFVDISGNIFIADTENSAVREVVKATGNIITVAGSATLGAGYSGDGSTATNAQLDLPNDVFVDSSGDILIADTQNSAVREVNASSGNIQTVAGSATLGAGYSGDGAAATGAQLHLPNGLFVDSSGNIIFADSHNYVLREVLYSTGYIQTIAGNHTVADSGDGGTATNASLSTPGGVFVDGPGNVFIADTENSVVREVVAATGDIQTVAGSATLGTGYSGDGFAATSAQLKHPNGVFVDSLGDIFIADTENSAIRCVVGATGGCFGSTLGVGSITTVAGTGTAGLFGDSGPATLAELEYPNGIYGNSAGDLFIADTGNSVIRCVVGSVGGCFGSALAAGYITTVAGDGVQCEPSSTTNCGDGAGAVGAQLNFPTNVFADSAGDLFIADAFDSEIREVVNAQGYLIQTVAGNGANGYAGDGAAATAAQLNTPYGVYVDSSGNIFIADTDNAVVREVVAATGRIQTIAGNGTEGYSGDGGPASNAPLFNPVSVAGDSWGNLFVADTDNLRIRELTLGLSWPTPAPIIYGTPLSATQLDATSTAAGTLVYAPVLGTVLPAGSQTLSVTFTPADTTHYKTETTTVVLTVNPATLTVTANNASRFYNSANPTFTDTIAGFVNGDTQSVVSGTALLSTTATTSSTVGAYPINVAAGTLSATNYSFSLVNGTLTVKQAAPAISWATPAAIFYGTLLSATQLDAGSIVAGTFVYTPSAGTVLPVGSQTLSVTFTPSDTTDYTTATATVKLLVKAPPAVTLSATSLSFGAETLLTPSTSQSVTLTNTGTGILYLTSIGVTGANASSFVFANSCGSSLAAGANCTIHGHFAPTATGPLTADITIVDNAANSPQSITLSGTGVAPAVSLSATSLSFGVENLLTTSAAQSVTLTNTGNGALTIASIAVTGANASSFIFNNSCGSSLAAGANCTIHGHFTPTGTGQMTAAVTITDNASDSPQSIALSGTGVTPAVSLSATSLSFGAENLLTTSASQSVTMTNTGNGVLAISSIAVTGANASSFVFVSSCGSTLAVSANCTIHGHFTPTTAGALTAAIIIADNAIDSPQSIALSGTGLAPAVSLSATSLSFGSENLLTTSGSQSVTMTNTGTAALSITSIAVTGTNASSFVFVNSCGSSLAAGANCAIHGHFTPTTAGALTAAITITDNATDSPQSIILSGTGLAPAVSLSATSLSFGTERLLTASASQSVTLTNTGTAVLSIKSIAVTGANASSFVFVNSCGSSLAVGANCTIHGHFTPTTTGALTAAITISDNATNSPQSISLSGIGQ